jgi:hypothetical protein
MSEQFRRGKVRKNTKSETHARGTVAPWHASLGHHSANSEPSQTLTPGGTYYSSYHKLVRVEKRCEGKQTCLVPTLPYLVASCETNQPSHGCRLRYWSTSFTVRFCALNVISVEAHRLKPQSLWPSARLHHCRFVAWHLDNKKGLTWISREIGRMTSSPCNQSAMQPKALFVQLGRLTEMASQGLVAVSTGVKRNVAYGDRHIRCPHMHITT